MKTTIIYITEENLNKRVRRLQTQIIGDKPTKAMAENAINELLKEIKEKLEIRLL